MNGYSNITTETELSELRTRGRGGQTDLGPMRFGGTGILHKCLILGGILRTCSTYTSVACDLHDGRGGSASRYANLPKNVGWGTKKRSFCAFCTEKRDRKQVVFACILLCEWLR